MDPSCNCVFARLVELEVKTLVNQRTEFAVHAIIADADDWRLGALDYLDQCSDTSTVTSADSIDFIHDDYALLRHCASHNACEWVLVFLLLLEACNAEVVERLV